MVKRVAVWPASIRQAFETKETPYKLCGKTGYVARALWWALGKLGALEPYMETVQTWEYVPHEQTDVLQAMLKAAGDDIWYVYEGKAVFIMGGETFCKLSGSPAFREVMMFRAGTVERDDPYYGRRIFDIPVHVVPNMTGMALVPRAIIEKR